MEGDSRLLKVLARGITNRDILGTNIGTERERMVQIIEERKGEYG